MKLLVAAALSLSAPAIAAPGRLPADVVPVAYRLTVEPDARALTFAGHGTVDVDVVRPVRSITLNAVDLSIGEASVDGVPAQTVTVDPGHQTATFTLARALAPGRHQLAMVWRGKINQSATGLFAIDYSNVDGTPDRMLATQFEAPDARRFAPMWDEPALKATFTLTAIAPTGQTAFSNMPVATKTADGAKTSWTFATTPRMSSYLLFLGIGNVERKTVMAGATEIGIITRKGVVDQGDYALASAKRILTAYNDYFGTPYPLPKLDMIAGPGSSQFFGAMENWGAIFYLERLLLVEPRLATESQRQDIFGTVAHEMAHQWFGDLVTMRWWDDLWLNEGFASWMASKVSNDLNPGWSTTTQTLAFDRQAAMSRDARRTTHAIIQHVETPDQINQAFDDITYRKGEAVIRMLEGAVGPDRFRDGVRRYMARYKFGNTVTDDLWTEVAAAASGSPVKPMMDSFTRQGGVPLIRVGEPKCANGATTIEWTLGRFGLDAPSKQPQTWIVPVRVGQARSTTTTATLGPVSPTVPTRVTVPGCGLTVVNAGQSAYFRTLYTPEYAARLRAGFATLTLDDQVGFLADSYALANSEDQAIEPYLALLGTVPPAADPLLWSLVATELAQIDGIVGEGAARDHYRAHARRILAPVFGKIGWTAQPGEAPAVARLRSDIIPVLGMLGDPAVQADAARYARLAFNQPDAVPGSIRVPALFVYAYTADAARWDDLRRRAAAERSPVARQLLYVALGGVADAALAQRALDLTLTDEIPAPVRGNVVRSVAIDHPALAFDWAVAHSTTVEAFLEASTRAQFIVGLPAGSGDPAVSRRVTAYAARALPPESRKAAETTVALIDYRAALRGRIAAPIAAWAAR